jgi:hypothetical protein
MRLAIDDGKRVSRVIDLDDATDAVAWSKDRMPADDWCVAATRKDGC